MKTLKSIVSIFVAILFTSCASTYKVIEPNRTNFPPSSKEGKVSLAYRYDVLREAGNKKMGKSEIRNDVRVVAIKLTNLSDSIIDIKRDLTFYCGAYPVTLMTPFQLKTQVQQSWWAYSLFCIGCLTFAPLDVIVFGGIGVGNMMVASNANNQFLNEAIKFDITNKQLKPGETMSGLIGFKTTHSDPITIKVKE